jgi:hypothetical protein
MLPLGGAIADFAAPIETDGALQRVVGFALVEPDLGTALQIISTQAKLRTNKFDDFRRDPVARQSG